MIPAVVATLPMSIFEDEPTVAFSAGDQLLQSWAAYWVEAGRPAIPENRHEINRVESVYRQSITDAVAAAKRAG